MHKPVLSRRSGRPRRPRHGVDASPSTYTVRRRLRPPPASRTTASAPVGASRSRAAGSACHRHRPRVRPSPRKHYGLSSADVSALAVSSVVPTEGNGLTNVYLQQRSTRSRSRPRC